MEEKKILTEPEEAISNCIKALREISITAEEFITQLNFILKRLGEMYREVK